MREELMWSVATSKAHQAAQSIKGAAARRRGGVWEALKPAAACCGEPKAPLLPKTPLKAGRVVQLATGGGGRWGVCHFLGTPAPLGCRRSFE